MMEFLSYAGWTIRTKETNKGIEAVMTDPWCNTFHQPTISWQSHPSAMLYAQKFIDWHIKLAAQEQKPIYKRTSRRAQLASKLAVKYTCFLEIQLMSGQTLLRQLRVRKIYCAHPQSMLSAVHRNLSRNLRHLVTDK
jgi:replicative superfamily II helicase